jgi:Rrf2 family protein
MRLSRRSEYALRALVDLARHHHTGPIPLAVLAERNRLPAKFLEQILASLRRAGIVASTLGSHGGYELAHEPGSITVGRVVRLLDGALAPLGCVSLRYYRPCSCPDEAACPLRDLMLDVRDRILAVLDEETIGELAARSGSESLDPRSLHADVLAGRSP